MIPRSPFPIFLFIAAMAFVAPWTARAGAPDAPRPCLVMPHPLKQGGPPTLRAAPRDHDHVHATGDGVFGAAEAPIRRLDMVVLLVDFEDQPMDSSTAYFGNAIRYLVQMYDQMSDGQLDLAVNLVERVYRLPETMAYYGLDDSIATREAILVRDAVRAADLDVDFSRYNAFMLFHAGPGQEADINNDSPEQIWSVFFRPIDLAYWLPDPDAELGIPTNDMTATGEPFYVTSMVVCPETESQDGYDFGLLGVVAHEFGHRFGLPDLYDTTAPDGFSFAESQGIGAFGLMGAGIWNENGIFPAEFEAWSRWFVGWLRPRIIAPEDGLEHRVEIPGATDPVHRRTAAVRVPLGGDEYLLIENRRRDYNGNGKFDFDDVNGNGKFDFGIDSYAGAEFDWHLPREPENLRLSPELDGSGLLIWHVDESIVRERTLYNIVNAEALQKGVDLEEADGIQDLDKLRFTFEAFGDAKDAFYAPFAVEFTPESTPDSRGYHGAASNVWITGISGPGEVMTFDLRFDGFEPGWPLELDGLVRDFQPLAVDLDGDGDREIAAGVVDVAGFGGVRVWNHDGTPYAPMAEHGVAGVLRAEPVVVRGWMGDGSPALAWVSGDSLLVRAADGHYVTRGPFRFDEPHPFAVLDRDPGRVRLTAADLDGDGADELVLGEARPGEDVNLTVVASAAPPGQPYLARATVQEDASGAVAAGELIPGDGVLELAAAVRTEGGGYLAVAVLSPVVADARFATPYGFSIGDTVRFTPPVLGDLDRDGSDEIVVGDSRGDLHALRFREPAMAGGTSPGAAGSVPNFCAGCFEEMPGWPVRIGTLDGDAVSLVDLDRDGYLEVLAFGPGNVLHALNYNGTSILSLPVAVPGENRFTAPFLAPLAVDLDGEAGDELCLPLPDGQVRGHDARGRRLDAWAYLGGTQQGLYPIVEDLDDDGRIEVLTFEDVTRGIPADLPIETGDESPGLERRGRAIAREAGPGTGRGSWPVYRADLGRSGRAPLPAASGDPVAGRVADALFVMPNPVRGGDAAIHYTIADDVEAVTIEIHDVSGRVVRTLEGSTFRRTDNVVRWNLRNDGGGEAAPGLYIARVRFLAAAGSAVRVFPFAVLR